MQLILFADIELAATFTLQKLLLIYKRERSVCCDDDVPANSQLNFSFLL